MVGVPNSSSTYVVGDEPWINIVGDKAVHDGIDIPVFASVVSSQKSHGIGGMYFVTEEGSQYGSGMTSWDFHLLFLKGVLGCNPSEDIGMALDKHFG